MLFRSVDTTNTLGVVTINPDDTLGYDPNGAFEALGAGQSATDSFAYTIDDGNGGFEMVHESKIEELAATSPQAFQILWIMKGID